MKVEFQFNSMQIDHQELQGYLPNIISAIGSYPVMQKTSKKRKIKTRKTVGALIEEIIDSIEK